MKYSLAGHRDTCVVPRPGQHVVVAGSGHAAGTCRKGPLALFQGRKNKTRSPDFPNGYADVTSGCQGLMELSRGMVASHNEVTGLSRTLVLYCHPKGTYNGLWCSPRQGGQLPVPFLTQKGDCGWHSSPSRSSLEETRRDITAWSPSQGTSPL